MGAGFSCPVENRGVTREATHAARTELRQSRFELLHAFSGRYLEEGSLPREQILAVVTAVIVVGYVWYLRRSNLLR